MPQPMTSAQEGGSVGACDVGAIDGCVEGREGMSRVPSTTGLLKKASTSSALTISKINALKQKVNRHNDTVAQTLLFSKVALEKRKDIEAAFRECKEAFLEVTTVLSGILEERDASASVSAEGLVRTVKDAVVEALGEGVLASVSSKLDGLSNADREVGKSSTYAAVIGKRSEARVPPGPAAKVSELSSFFVLPDTASGLTTSQATKDTFCNVLKPADCALKVNRITLTHGNGVRVKAFSPDIAKLSTHPALVKAGLKITEQIKLKPRIIVYRVPLNMSKDEICNELAAQNLSNDCKADIKFIYRYRAKEKRSSSSCVLEVSPRVRDLLFSNSRIYLRYLACRFADHI